MLYGTSQNKSGKKLLALDRLYLQLCEIIWILFQIHAFDSYPVSTTTSIVTTSADSWISQISLKMSSKQITCLCFKGTFSSECERGQAMYYKTQQN